MTQTVARCAMDNPYKCRLTLLAPHGKGRMLEKILSPLTSWVDPSHQVIAVEERDSYNNSSHGHQGNTLDKREVKDCLVTPALSVMMFMKETGPLCVSDVQKVLKRQPWKFHHKVELQQRSFPKTALAKQEFYKLSSDLPLFAACPVPTDQEHLRINMYVHNYPAMVEFYRTVTETEIETSKPEFCIFRLYHQPGLDVQLSLKRSRHLFPVPVDCAYVSFNVTSIGFVKTLFDVKHIGHNIYTTRDPDGNFVVLFENVHAKDINKSATSVKLTNKQMCCRTNGVSNVPETCAKLAESILSQDDMKSMRSVSEIDSGRYSDVEGGVGDQLVPQTNRKCVVPLQVISAVHETCNADDSDGYSSSFSSLTLKVGNKANKVQNDRRSGHGYEHPQSSPKSQTGINDRRTSSAIVTNKRKEFTPVYI